MKTSKSTFKKIFFSRQGIFFQKINSEKMNFTANGLHRDDPPAWVFMT